MSTIIELNDGNIADFLSSERAALVLTKSSCAHCARYQQEIVELLQQGGLAGTRVGKLVLDRPGSAVFKRENGWVREVAQLPYTLLYRRGTRVAAFAASRAAYLAERIEEELDFIAA